MVKLKQDSQLSLLNKGSLGRQTQTKKFAFLMIGEP